jgi:hypothetical protein
VEHHWISGSTLGMLVLAAAVIIVLIWGFLFNGFGLSSGYHVVSNNAGAGMSSSQAATPAGTAPAAQATSAAPATTPATPAAPAAQPIAVSGPGSGATVGRIFAVVGTGTIPQGQHLVVYVWAPGAQQYFFDGGAIQSAGTNQWTVPQVFVGSCDAADNGHTYTVFLRMMGDTEFAQVSSSHSAGDDKPLPLSGSPVTSWNVVRASAGC